jgi:hypothetical protein
VSTEPTTLASEAELAEALAEAQKTAVSIPSLDAGPTDAVVPVPITSHLRPLPRSAPETPESSATLDATTTAADTQPDNTGTTAPASEPKVLRARGVGLLRGLDCILAGLNRPFAWLGPGPRRLIGYIAITTIVMSLLAGFLLPAMFPHPDPIGALHQQALQARSSSTGEHSPASATPHDVP